LSTNASFGGDLTTMTGILSEDLGCVSEFESDLVGDSSWRICVGNPHTILVTMVLVGESTCGEFAETRNLTATSLYSLSLFQSLQL
jgi:hypothetical protein